MMKKVKVIIYNVLGTVWLSLFSLNALASGYNEDPNQYISKAETIIRGFGGAIFLICLAWEVYVWWGSRKFNKYGIYVMIGGAIVFGSAGWIAQQFGLSGS